jgi:hypothetical protein
MGLDNKLVTLIILGIGFFISFLYILRNFINYFLLVIIIILGIGYFDIRSRLNANTLLMNNLTRYSKEIIDLFDILSIYLNKKEGYGK